MLKRILCGLLCLLLPCAALAEETTTAKALVETPMRSIHRASVHDPSIVKDPATGTYYVFGSHCTAAYSSDLVSWKRISGGYTPVNKHKVYGKLTETFAGSFLWAGYDDGDCAGGGYAVWAPDVHWDARYQWEDGTEGAWLLYYSASSTWRRSCIGVLAAREIAGPYTYVDTIVYSGFTLTGDTDGTSTRDTTWSNDYLNLARLVELGSANGGIDEVADRWFKNNGKEYNSNEAPNCIDPCIIDDTEGRMWMVYGSWSGGLFLLELDPATGLAIYPGVDGTDEVSGNFVDRYFGVHIAGGNHQSGEGPYIIYDAEAGYYFLYETYGGLNAEGGYNMRLFRSKDITGPYVDVTGREATKNKRDNDRTGLKLIGNYQFTGERGYRAAGHNSALIDDDGQRYLVYHQRFDKSGESYEVRVRQQFLNEDDWPVNAVYENRNETIARYDAAEVVGSYELIDHGTQTSGLMLENGAAQLLADGTVTGSVTGTWEKKDSGRGYDYLTITAESGTVYKGFFYRQLDESLQSVMTFSCIGSNDTCLWGRMVTEE